MPLIISFITALAARYGLRYSLIIIYVGIVSIAFVLTISAFTFAFHSLVAVYNMLAQLLTYLDFGTVSSSYAADMSNFLGCIGFYQGLQIFMDLVLSSLLSIFVGFSFMLIISFLKKIKEDIANIGKML